MSVRTTRPGDQGRATVAQERAAPVDGRMAAGAGPAPTPAGELREHHAARVAAFYRGHANWLIRAVTRRAEAPEATIEDACQAAWTILLRRPDLPLDERARSWLIVVATHEAWRRASLDREIPAGIFHPDEKWELPGRDSEAEPVAQARDVDARVIALDEHRERVADLLALKPRERRELYLQAAGYSYRDIARMTASSYTAVNRRINEGRAHLRHLQHQREQGQAA